MKLDNFTKLEKEFLKIEKEFEEKLKHTKEMVLNSIEERHKAADKIINDALDNIYRQNNKNEIDRTSNEESFKEMEKMLKELEF